MFQMARDGDVPGLETLLKRLGPPKSARVISKLNTLGTIHILRKHLYNIKPNFNLNTKFFTKAGFFHQNK